jgi:hypothetical protein
MTFSIIGRMICVFFCITMVAAAGSVAFAQDEDAFYYNGLLGRGINLGNALGRAPWWQSEARRH